jgi:hypothetical protein
MNKKMSKYYKNQYFKIFLAIILIVFFTSVLSDNLDLLKRPVREFATMTMAMNPDKTEVVRLKVPWAYLAPNLSYLSAADQKSFYSKAKLMMHLMGLSEVSNKKNSVKSPKEIHYTSVFSFDALYPTFEAKNERNIEQFVSKQGVINKVIQVRVSSSAKGYYWNNFKKSILSSYHSHKISVDRKLNETTYKNYGFSLIYLPGQYGLVRLGLADDNVNRLRKNGVLEGFIPSDIWENRNEEGELLSYMKCMRPDLGWFCNHTMHVAEINSRIELSYHISLLKDWQFIESNIRQVFKKFIVLGRE